MSAATGDLSLEQFILETNRLGTGAMSLSEFATLAVRLELDDALVGAHVRFDDAHYARNLLCRTPQFELLVLCWRPGQASTVHDHAGSLNVTRVYRGTLVQRKFSRRDGGPGTTRLDQAESGELPCGPVEQIEEEVFAGAGSATVDRGDIHQLRNDSDESLVTVHLYAPPLTDIVVYSLTAATTEVMRLRYTLQDDFA
ncbi:MAG TPA: cysteine dioxygenase family protein [Thermoleophilia bacterium]|nr:cysteine dioxygenase family protein [Thermoleophilia bacterium]